MVSSVFQHGKRRAKAAKSAPKAADDTQPNEQFIPTNMTETPLSPAQILHLQRTVGNRATQRLLAQQARPAAQPEIARRTPAEVVQRAMGVEFEIDQVTTSKKNFWGTHKNLAKKDKLLIGQGFKLEADEMPGRSNMEFVTDAFPETADGGDKLATALEAINGVIQALMGQNGQTISAATLNTYGTPVANRFLRPTANTFIGKPQVTAGIKLDAMDRFFGDIAFRNIAPGNTTSNNNAARMLGGQLGANTGVRDSLVAGAGMLDVSQARAAVTQALVTTNNLVQTDPTNPNLGSPALRALTTQLTMYLVRGAQGSPGYGKLIAGGIMGRTDFAAMFNLLPKPELDYFRDFPDMFVFLVLEAAKIAAAAAGYTGTMSAGDAVFEGKLYNDPGMYGNDPNFQKDLLPELKRKDWLEGIVGGTDMLTATNYPGKQKKKDEIESLGGYGGNMDNVSQIRGGNDPAPIVELRGLKPIFAGLLTPMMLDLFRYIHTVNTGGVEDYPGHLLDTSAGDQTDLALNQGNSQAIRQQIVQDALDEIQWW